MQGIYMIKNLVNQKVYIGQSVNVKYRLNGHRNSLNNNVHKNEHLKRSWNKYGENNFELILIEEVSDESKLTEREQFWIDEYNSLDEINGYNIREAGNKGKLSDTTKIKIGLKSKGKTISDETKKKIGIAQKNKIVSDETRRKMGNAHKNKKMSEDAKNKISESKKLAYELMTEEEKRELIQKRSGWKHSDSTKQKIGIMQKGKVVSEETRKKTSEALTKYGIEIKEQIGLFLKNNEPIKSISEKLNIPISTLYRIKREL